jgi:hypothetical protein
MTRLVEGRNERKKQIHAEQPKPTELNSSNDTEIEILTSNITTSSLRPPEKPKNLRQKHQEQEEAHRTRAREYYRVPANRVRILERLHQKRLEQRRKKLEEKLAKIEVAQNEIPKPEK